MKTFLTLAILSSIAATPAMAERFTHEGTTYDYQVKSVDGGQVIAGTSNGEAFRLRVSGTRVTGKMGRWPVHFRISAETAAATVARTTVLAAK